MDSVFRFVLRLMLIPSAILVAATVQAFVILFGEWRIGDVFGSLAGPEEMPALFGALLSAAFETSLYLGLVWLLALIGILFSEAFAIRSVLFHIANGALCAALAVRLYPLVTAESAPVENLTYVLAAGIVGGLLYWLIAGFGAGFWKPVFRPPPPPPGRAPAPPR